MNKNINIIIIVILSLFVYNCKNKKIIEDSLIIGKWTIVEVSNITENDIFKNKEKIDFYFLFQKEGLFKEYLFYRERNGKWELKGNYLRLDYNNFGVKDYQIISYNNNTIVIKLLNEEMEIRYLLQKQ